MNDTLKSAIWNIVQNVPSECIFDSHFVIATLIKEHSDAYLRFAVSLKDPKLTTAQMHGLISQEVGRCNNVVRVGDALSYTIHGKPDKCACWRHGVRKK